MILADPPWVESAKLKDYPDDPRSAIDGGADGLDIARKCLEIIGKHLRPNGHAILQLGSTEQVSHLQAQELAKFNLKITEVREFGTDGVLVHLVADAPVDS